MANYPKKLYFLIVDIRPDDFEFDANIRDNQIVVGTHMEGCDEEYDDGEGNIYPYANYEVKQIKDYPLMVEENTIDDTDTPYFTHTSFGYYLFSSRFNALKFKEEMKSRK